MAYVNNRTAIEEATQSRIYLIRSSYYDTYSKSLGGGQRNAAEFV